MQSNSQLTTTRTIAPDDLRRGSYIAISVRVHEFIRGRFDEYCRPLTIERIAALPDEDDLLPMKVLSVCVPFVLVQKPDGSARAIDLRQNRVSLVDPAFGRAAFRACSKKEKESSEKSQKNSKKKRR